MAENAQKNVARKQKQVIKLPSDTLYLKQSSLN